MFAKKKTQKQKATALAKEHPPWDSLISIFMLALLMMCLSLLPPCVLPPVLFIFCTSHLLCRRFTPKLS